MKSQLSLRGCAAAQTESHGNTSFTEDKEWWGSGVFGSNRWEDDLTQAAMIMKMLKKVKLQFDLPI